MPHRFAVAAASQSYVTLPTPRSGIGLKRTARMPTHAAAISSDAHSWLASSLWLLRWVALMYACREVKLACLLTLKVAIRMADDAVDAAPEHGGGFVAFFRM
jgi:hypothetical protein